MERRVRRKFAPDARENIDYVVCIECGWKFRAITDCHLKHAHNSTLVGYKRKYPSANLYADIVRDKLRTFLGKTHSPEYLEKCRKRMTGKNNPMYGMTGDANPSRRPEVKQKLRELLAGSNNGMYGKKHTEEWKRQHSKAMTLNNPMKNPEVAKLLTGEGNGRWLGGIAFFPYSPEFNGELKSKVRTRDNFVCQICGIEETQLVRKLDVHHIDKNKNNNKLNNLVSLCSSCHNKIK